MQLISEEQIKIVETKLNIEDALKKDNVSIKIEAAHAGVMNGNFLFYLPKALVSGANSLNTFYKPLQKKHYSKTLGYIYNSEYIETNTKSKYYKDIIASSNSKELVNNVKKYIKTKEYEQNKTGFGVLVAKAKLHDKNKIKDLQYNDTGTVSVAGDAGIAYCSICGNHVAECGHKLGYRYQDNELCFGIVADDFEVDHISFETIPANWETNSLIIADSGLLGNIELIEEGQLMKLSFEKLKEKLGDIESVLTELDLLEYLDRYLADVTAALKSQFLLPAEQKLPFNTPLTTYITNLILSQLEESEDKDILTGLFGTSYSDIFDGKTEEEIKNILSTITEKVIEPKVEPVVNQEPEDIPTNVLEVTDSDKLVLAITDSLTATLNNSFQSAMDNLFTQFSELFTKDQEAKANKILSEQINAVKEDLASSTSLNETITVKYKESLINQIILLKNVDSDSEYVSKLKDRSIQELTMTLEDHIQLNASKVETPVVEPTVDLVDDPANKLKVEDSLKTITKVEPTVAIESMKDDEPSLTIEDSDSILNTIVNGVESKLSNTQFASLYKSTVFEHGSKVAKKLHSALKAQQKL